MMFVARFLAAKLLAVISRVECQLTLLTLGIFVLFPELDLLVSGWFYDGGEFFLRDHPLIQLPYIVLAKAHIPVLIGLVVVISVFFRRRDDKYAYRQRAMFTLCLLLLAPGLIVNGFLKENSFGRPRPVHIQQFGGDKHYAPAFHYSGECAKNCSFSSGHAAFGFSALAIAWIFPSRFIFIAAMLLGSYVGFGRIAQGGHFLSDVIMSFWVVYWSTRLLSHQFSWSTYSPWKAPFWNWLPANRVVSLSVSPAH